MIKALEEKLDLERVAFVHGALVLVTALSLSIPGGPPWVLTAPANLLLLLTLPSLVLAPVLLMKSRVLLGCLQVASVAVGAYFFAVPLTEDWTGEPRRYTEPGEYMLEMSTPKIRIATFNTGVGLASAEAIADFLEETRPDIVVLVELTDRVAAALVPLCEKRYPYRALYPDGIDGKAVLSRYPILTEALIRLRDGRPTLQVELDVNGQSVELMAVHFSPSIGVLDRGAAAGRDLEQLSSLLDPNGPSIMAGDFNTTERSPSHVRLVEAGFGDSFAEVGWGLGRTFPMFGRYFGLPIGRFMRIDYVWHGAALKATRAFVGRDLGSDHLPVIADLVWRN